MDKGPQEHRARVANTVEVRGSKTSDELDVEGRDAALGVQNDDKNDPLNWPYWTKVYVVLLVSGLSFIIQMGAALINPAFVPMSKDLNVTIEQASYSTTIFILFAGITPMFVTPFSVTYGRRYLYLVFTLIAIVAQVGSGLAATYGGVITGRVFYGIGGSIPLGIGAATICDLFTQGERGLYMGIYVLCVNNGPHLAPVIGGYIALHLHWRWCFYIPGIITAGLWVVMVFTFPETLYSRLDAKPSDKFCFWSKLAYTGKVIKRPIRPRDFAKPFRMIRYWAILLPSLYWMTINAYGSLLYAVTGSRIAFEIYRFNVAQTGLLMGLPLTIGCSIGEATAGWISDRIIEAYAKRHNGYRKPEVRLALLPGCLALVAGVIAYGPCVQDRKPWITLAVCMAVTGFGVQVGATMVYTYTTDCYRPEAAETGAVLNLFKSVFTFTVAFYALPFSQASGYNVAFPVMGLINGVCLLPLVWLWFDGERIRKRQGTPQIQSSL